MEKNKNVLILIIASIIALLFLFGIFGIGGYGLMGFGMGFGFLFMILPLVLVVWIIISLVNPAQQSKKNEDALEILKKRYASGKITKKQYEDMKKKLLEGVRA